MKKEISFEQALELLEEAVKSLESGALSLDESIRKYEEAIGYVKVCNARLEAAEQRVRILTEGKDGAVTDLPFDVNYEN